MKAHETNIQSLLEGTRQYIVPLFQRTYSWEKEHWKTLWDDIIELYEDDNSKDHFIGSIVTIPVQSKPEGVPKYLLIDGQQRFTTIYLLLTALRDSASEQKIVDEINTYNIFNPERYAENNTNDRYKLLPTQNDRMNFFNILTSNQDIGSETKLSMAYKYFSKKIGVKTYDSAKLLDVLKEKLSVVSITLDKDDNPHLIFESLNYKGKPLTQADLIRNYFFMKIHVNAQEELYGRIWKPMHDALGDKLTEFIRHFLLKDGREVKKTEIYASLKEIVDNKVNDNKVLDYLEEIFKFSLFYNKLLNPNLEPNSHISNRLYRLNQLEITTAYPFLLNIYDIYDMQQITDNEFIEILSVVENFILRRFVCQIPTNTLNKIFPILFRNIDKECILDSLKNELIPKNYPRNQEFVEKFKTMTFYSNNFAERNQKTKLILESLELSYNHKESPSSNDLTIEHIMPQTLSSNWKTNLGEDYLDNYDSFVNSIGNLTLTAYNSELSNATFDKKKVYFENSNLELNKYFKNINNWTFEEIKQRSSYLADQALLVWPSLMGDKDSRHDEKIIVSSNITGSKPEKLFILGQEFPVSTWKDVLIKTLENLYTLEESKFEELLQEYPHRISLEETRFRAPYRLDKYCIETHLSAKIIRDFCLQVIEYMELTEEDWKVELKNHATV